MRFRNLAVMTAFVIVAILAAADLASGQGRGGGGRPAGAGGGNGGGRPTTAGQPSGMGVDRGISTSGTRSDGRADTGRGTASTRSNGRSDAGLDRARMGRTNGQVPEDAELRRYTGISRKLGTTPEALRATYEAALAGNPDLTWGQFVSANMVADNLGTRYPNITTAAILGGLRQGDSLGETLERLGLGEEQAEQAEKAAKREIKESRKNNQ
jgi:hypothetical protein